MKTSVSLAGVDSGRQALASLWCECVKPALLAGQRLQVTIEPETRTPEQNAAQWPILSAFSKQLQWPINGQMVYMTPDDWKDVLTAAFRRESARIAMGLDGGVVMLGLRTSKMNKGEFSDWLEFLMATAAHRGVNIDHDQESRAHEGRPGKQNLPHLDKHENALLESEG